MFYLIVGSSNKKNKIKITTNPKAKLSQYNMGSVIIRK